MLNDKTHNEAITFMNIQSPKNIQLPIKQKLQKDIIKQRNSQFMIYQNKIPEV